MGNSAFIAHTIAPALESPWCSSCANGHLSCSKHWANFITFGLCLSTQHLSNGVLVAVRNGSISVSPRGEGWGAMCGVSCLGGSSVLQPSDCSKNQIFVLEDRPEANSTRNMPSLTTWTVLYIHFAFIQSNSWHKLLSNFVLSSLFSQEYKLKKLEVALEDFPVNWGMSSEAEVVFSKMDLQLLFINAHVMAAVVSLLSFTAL